MDTTLMWRSIQWPGTEHLIIREDGGSIEADGLVVSTDERPLRLRYRLRCDTGWTTRELDISEATSGLEVQFRADGNGRWTDGVGRHLPDLDGCVDVDIAATPLTNTLPIRRLTWEVGQVRDLRMVYFLVPELTWRAADQRYSCLAMDGTGATYRYQSGSFETEIRVDRDGFVLDYPGIWTRTWPDPAA